MPKSAVSSSVVVGGIVYPPPACLKMPIGGDRGVNKYR